ncbi:hypothetical protein SALBM311S_01195 [Streptomyces alboniger]
MADGRSGPKWTVWSAASSVVAVAGDSPVPGLRVYRGKAPLATWTRMRCPRRKRYAVGHNVTETPCGSAASERLTRPSHTFHDRPSWSTSQSRTNTSACGRLEENQISALTSPTTSTSWSSTGVV